MKFTLLSMALLSVIVSSCGPRNTLGELGQCLELATEYGTDALEFSSNQTKGNCEAALKSLENYIKKCDLADTEKADLEDAKKDYNCSQYN